MSKDKEPRLRNRISRRTFITSGAGLLLIGMGAKVSIDAFQEIGEIEQRAEKEAEKIISDHPTNEEVIEAQGLLSESENTLETIDLSEEGSIIELRILAQSDEIFNANQTIQKDQKWDMLVTDLSAEMGRNEPVKKTYGAMALLTAGIIVGAIGSLPSNEITNSQPVNTAPSIA